MLEPEEIQKQDSLSLCLTYDNWPRYCKEAYAMKVDFDYNDVNQIIFTGMGGSATSGEIISYLFNHEKPMKIVKGYHLPNGIDNRSLVVASSVSGNTQETLSTLIDAIKYDAKIIGISSGGKLEKLCNANRVRHVNIKMLGLPRATLPYLLYVQLKLIKSLVNITDNQVFDSIRDLERLSRKIRSSNEVEINASKQLAIWMLNSLPVCYCSPSLIPVAIRFTNSLNENAKIHAIFGDIIESLHNSIEPWSCKSELGLKPILLPCINDDENVKRRFKIVEDFLASRGYDVYKLPRIGSNLLGNMICLVYFLDYASIYLALLRNIDPSSTPAIDFVKNNL